MPFFIVTVFINTSQFMITARGENARRVEADFITLFPQADLISVERKD